MVYSSAEIMGVPVETVVKEFRRLRNVQGHKELAGYASDFEDFLTTDTRLFPEEARHESLHHQVFGAAAEIFELANRFLNDQHGKATPTGEQTELAFTQAVSFLEVQIRDFETLNPGPTNSKKIRELLNDSVSRVRKDLENQFGLERTICDRIGTFLLDQVFVNSPIGPETGIVISGFGEDEIFPSLQSFEFKCSCFGLNRITNQERASISRNEVAHIRPFAQSDVMETFIEGWAPEYKQFLFNFSNRFLDDVISRSAVDATLEQFAITLKTDFLSALGERFKELRQRQFIDPLMDAVASMPKEEMATLAEALINLTSLKRKASNDLETVGGPTDVAVISKGDGLIWMRRKHYFDPALNPGFCAKYLEEGK